ncbi:MAG: NapC/NirT family cytochrome c [Rhodospirillales bacterium]|nr:NapC/NirT family cytochrome c [Rhodospirillales bacterium]
MNEHASGKATPNLWCQIWSALRAPTARYSLGGLLVVGIVAGVMGWGAFNWALEITNTQTFCVTCHEMEQNVFREFTGTVHDTNKSGVRATCPDCHVPRDWIHKVRRKIQASNELFHHVLGTIDTREKFEAKRLTLAKSVWQSMKETDSRECRNCHDFQAMDITRQASRARQRHLDAVGEGKTCIDCHKGIAHKLPKGAFGAEQELNETWGAKK